MILHSSCIEQDMFQKPKDSREKNMSITDYRVRVVADHFWLGLRLG
jgi:hypothetical protein